MAADDDRWLWKQGFTIYFLVSRSSQKYANIKRDCRISIAVGDEPTDLREIKAVFAGAKASEVSNAGERDLAWQLLKQRHPNLADYSLPEPSDAVLIRAHCKYVSVLDYTKGYGHSDALTIDLPIEG